MIRALAACVLLLTAGGAAAQTVSQRGFVEGGAFLYPEAARNDPTRVVADVLVRDDLFVKPVDWLQFAVGADVRASTHDQVDDEWRLDVSDRTARRPPLSVRRLSATANRGPFTIDIGKQFIRWGKADILTPTDRLAPRDFLNVVDTEFLAVTGVRAVAQFSADAFEVAWVPRFTPSRVPLLDQRWTVVPPEVAAIPLVDGGARLPGGAQTGVRWSHTGAAFEYSLSFFDGFNHLPNVITAIPAVPTEIAVTRTYPSIRTYGGDAAVPTRWLTIKGEAANLTSSTPGTDEYVLYVVQLERQTGEWVIVGGYAGEALTKTGGALTFAPDRGMAQSFVGRAAYTLDPNRSVAFEAAVHQSGAGVYGKAEYSQARGAHWRTTLTAVVIAGHTDDFLGQYHDNSHARLTLRYSF